MSSNLTDEINENSQGPSKDEGAPVPQEESTEEVSAVTEPDPNLPDNPEDNQSRSVDEELAEEAYQKVEEIVVKRFSQAMDEIGTYLLDTFFDKDIKRAQNKTPNRPESFNALIDKLKERQAKPPSKSWLYNAINTAADKKYFQDNEFPEYEQLEITHRVYMASVHDIETKKALIEETIKNEYSTRKLKERINEMKKRREVIKLKDIKESTSLTYLKEEPVEKLEYIQKKIENRIRWLSTQKKSVAQEARTLATKKDEIVEYIKEQEKKAKSKKQKKQ